MAAFFNRWFGTPNKGNIIGTAQKKVFANSFCVSLSDRFIHVLAIGTSVIPSASNN